jgi:hypothetical protein
MNANEIQKHDTIAVRRNNERKARQGLVLDISTESFAGFESVIALVAFDKTTESVNLSNANFQLIWRLEAVA